MVMTIGPRRIARLALLGTALLPGAMVRAQQSDGLGIVTGEPDNGSPRNVLVVRAGPDSDPPRQAASDSTPKPTTTTEGEKLEESSIRLIGSRNQCIQCHAVDTSKRPFANIPFANMEGGAINQFLVDFGGTPDPQGLGATLEQADRAVRAQLGLPDDRGLVVWSLAPDGPAARAGLQVNDILLTLDGKPLDRPQDFTARLKEAGDKAVPMALVRAGKPMTIRVKPEYRVTFTAVHPKKTEYSIGVSLKPIDAALRAHLPALDRLERNPTPNSSPGGFTFAQQGLVVDGVVPKSPADKAGLKQSDILLAIGDAPIVDSDSLLARIQTTGGKPVQFRILRAGKPMTIEITPTPKGGSPAREVARDEVLVCPALNAQMEWSKALAEWKLPPLLLPPHETRLWDTWSKTVAPSNSPHPGSTADSDRVEKRLDALGRELKQLQESIEALRKTLKPDDKPEGRRK